MQNRVDSFATKKGYVTINVLARRVGITKKALVQRMRKLKVKPLGKVRDLTKRGGWAQIYSPNVVAQLKDNGMAIVLFPNE